MRSTECLLVLYVINAHQTWFAYFPLSLIYSDISCSEFEMFYLAFWSDVKLFVVLLISYEAWKSTSPHFKFAKLIIKLIKREANVREEWQCEDQYLSRLVMQMPKLKCGEILSYAS